MERRLNISRPTRLLLEEQGVLTPVRLTPSSHRRYRLDQVEALVPDSAGPAPEVDGPQGGEVSPTSPPTPRPDADA
ncbi:hypothetical protein [uncultured Microbacterium sp.]|uniref:hypothetical protein n=1 Tax=uncultured Microbacterium sp. TaxID=191216 RepID=UPI0025DE1CED|nr:hypothetical protein [uncultured Microbacterium sp.]